MFSRIPFKRVNWLISSFLIGTLLLALTAVPAYIYWFGRDRARPEPKWPLVTRLLGEPHEKQG